MKVKNVSPVGDLDVAIAGSYATVPLGEVIEVSAELGASLLEQPANWAPVVEKETKE